MLRQPTDVELVSAAAATYTATAQPFTKDPLSAACVFLTTRADGMLLFPFEGTHNPPGWLADFSALHVWDHSTTKHPTLGYIHLGFYQLAMRLLPPILHEIRKDNRPFTLVGHSLGAALALLVGAMLIDRGLRPAVIGAFAPPRVGDARFVRVATSVPVRAFRYGDDPVTQVPFYIPLFFPYRQVPLIAIGKPLPDRFSCHHVQNYVDAVHAKATES